VDDVGPLLADLHSALRDYPGELPTTPPMDVPQVLDYLRRAGGLAPLTESDIPDLLADAVRVGRELSAQDAVPLHGDAHPGNLLHTKQGPVWTDFEDAWRGPIGWDLACLELTGRLDGRAAVAGYPDAPPESARTSCLAGRRLQSIVWSMMFHRWFPSPDRTAETAGRIRYWRAHR
jgi:Ser/Thr protein kinase RdoA (MazF antagonist)